MRVVGCFLEYKGKFVLLHRHANKPDGNMWGLPSGKVEAGESDNAAMLRELEEETGYRADETELEYIGEYEFTTPSQGTFVYITYRVVLKDPHDVALEESAHTDHVWVSAQEADSKADLIYGLRDLFRLVGLVS